MRLVLDTNVLIAGLLTDGLCRDLLKRRVLGHQLIISVAMLAELDRTFRAKFDENSEQLPLLVLYRRRAAIVKPARLPAPVCRDPDDDVVLATALAGKADVTITGDTDLLTLGAFQGIPILSPRQFVEVTDRES